MLFICDTKDIILHFMTKVVKSERVTLEDSLQKELGLMEMVITSRRLKEEIV